MKETGQRYHQEKQSSDPPRRAEPGASLSTVEEAVAVVRLSRTRQENRTRLQDHVKNETASAAIRSAFGATGARHMCGKAPPHCHGRTLATGAQAIEE